MTKEIFSPCLFISNVSATVLTFCMMKNATSKSFSSFEKFFANKKNAVKPDNDNKI
jgi:hypothetical protein